MTLPVGTKTWDQICAEFGMNPRTAVWPADFYGKGGVPSSGPLSFADFDGKSNVQPVYDLPSGSWVVPSGVTKITVLCIGGGGNGANSSGSGGATAGGGGGGGASSYSKEIAVTPGETLTIVTSAGGSVSSIARGGTILVSANGGANASSNAGAAGGTTGGVGTTKFAGAAGAASAGSSSVAGRSGGRGGGAGGLTAAGNLINGNAPGGNGGQGGQSEVEAATNGLAYGGGGGGGTNQTGLFPAGAAGAAGLVRVWSHSVSDIAPASQTLSNTQSSRSFNASVITVTGGTSISYVWSIAVDGANGDWSIASGQGTNSCQAHVANVPEGLISTGTLRCTVTVDGVVYIRDTVLSHEHVESGGVGGVTL